MASQRSQRSLSFLISLWAMSIIGSRVAAAPFTILHSFQGGSLDGDYPLSDLVVSGSTLYGTTQYGGASPIGNGTVFRIDTDGSNYDVVHKFNPNGSEGHYPASKLAVSGSVIYGTTRYGSPTDDGTLYQVNTDGTGFQVLHSFAASPSGGSQPYPGVTLSGSKLYGMKQLGGTNDDGLVYSFDTTGPGYSTLHSFDDLNEGGGPWGDVHVDGTTMYGMTTKTTWGTAGIFRMNTDGTGFAKLHTFTGAPTDGMFAYGSLTQDGTKLYGMTRIGGVNDFGTIFSLNTDGSGYSILHSFADYGAILGDLTVSGSMIYGMTTLGGLYGRGSIFQFDTGNGVLSTLHSFSGGAADGDGPMGSLIMVGSKLYGTTAGGGFYDHGTVFSFEVPEPSTIGFLAMATALFVPRRRRS